MTLRGDLFQGQQVRLSQVEPEAIAKGWACWGRNTTFYRYLSDNPPIVWSAKKHQEWAEKDDGDVRACRFHILARPDDRLIGFVSLYQHAEAHRDAWTGIGIGEPEYWSHGYGSEAMRLALDYAFLELNLHRVSLGVFEYNRRAIRSYEKVGFRLEGRERGAVLREGQRSDVLYMGILRREWQEEYAGRLAAEAANGN